MSRGQISLAVKHPAVKCHLRSNIPRSNVTVVKCPVVKCPAVKCHIGQMSSGQMSLAVKCPVVKCHLRSNVPRSNITMVICHKILKWSKVRGQMSRGQMRLLSKEIQSTYMASSLFFEKRITLRTGISFFYLCVHYIRRGECQQTLGSRSA